MQYLCGRIHEHRSHHDQQQHGKHEHHTLCGLTQIVTNQLWKARTIVTHGEHARQVVVGGSCKDTAEDNPQISRRTELRTHDGTEDRSRTGNVKELNHENLPVGKHDVVKSVCLGNGGRHTVIWSKHPFHEATVEQIT